MVDPVAAFLQSYPDLADPDVATSQCRIANDRLVEALRRDGVPAESVWVRGHRVEPPNASARAMRANRHMLVRLPGRGFVDVTRRQYEPGGTHPRFYSSESDLAFDWREIDDGPVDGGSADEAWRDLGLTPWRPGAPGKGILIASSSVHCWTVDSGGEPHHPGALTVLGISPEEVQAYFTVDKDGTVRLAPERSAETAARIVSIEPGLRLEPAWHP